jgi:hypothetical protein
MCSFIVVIYLPKVSPSVVYLGIKSLGFIDDSVVDAGLVENWIGKEVQSYAKLRLKMKQNPKKYASRILFFVIFC